MPAARKPAYLDATVWKISSAWWVFAGLMLAGSHVVSAISRGESTPAWQPIVGELSSAMAFALIVPFFVELGLRFRIQREGLAGRLAVHLVGLAAFTLLHVALMVAIRKGVYFLFDRQVYSFGNVRWELLYEASKDAMSYIFLMAITHLGDYYVRYRQRELTAARLETSLALARLEALEQQIQPHFLFNALNMISSTIHEDVNRGDRMITRLSDLLRMTVRRRGLQEVTLGEELDLLDAYLEIMRARFEERLEVTVTADPGVRRCLVPPLLLQPLVENAIKYGIADREEGGRVTVLADRSGDSLRVHVADDGPGVEGPTDQLLTQGLGLSATAERLEHLYGSDHRFEIRSPEAGGFVVEIVLPYRSHPEPSPALADFSP